jgi:hypothetical protein
MTTFENIPVNQSDGFDDTGNDGRVIQGKKLKCIDGNWSTADNTPLPNVLLALSAAHHLQCWKENAVVDTIREHPLPDPKDLNAQIPREEWDTGLDGNPRPPWQHAFIVYLLDPTDATVYTYINSTVGASMAYENLKSRVVMMRKMRGVSVYPIVTLGKATFPSKVGLKLRPEFVIVDWRELGGAGAALPAPATPQLPAPVAAQTEPETVREIAEKSAFAPKAMPDKPVKFGETMPGKKVKPVTLSEELNDELPDFAAKKTA